MSSQDLLGVFSASEGFPLDRDTSPPFINQVLEFIHNSKGLISSL